MTVSNHSDGLDASVRFVARKNPSQLRPDHNDGAGNLSPEERNSLLDGSVEGHRANPFALKQTGNGESGNQEKTLIKPPLLGNTATMDELNLGRKLGSGTYGTVYSANFTGMHGFLADKVIAAKVLNATKRRHRQNNVKIDETGSREEEETATKGVESNAMHLLHQRTKRVLESTKFHTTIQMNVPDHLAASPSVRTALLTNLLRQKRLKYQEKLDNVTRRLIAKRQTTVQLNIEDVRRFLHSGGDDGDYEYNVVTHVEEEEEDNSKYTGFLMLQSLEEGEIKQLVAKGIQMTSGFIVVDEPKSPSSKTKKR